MFNTRDGDVVDSTLLSLSEESVVDLSRAKNVTLHILGGDEAFRFWFRDVALEVGIWAKLVKVGTSERVTEEVFGEEDNERLSVIAVNLSSEGVEDVGRDGGNHELHIAVLVLPKKFLGRRVNEGVVVTKLEETFDPGRRVLGSLSVVTVRKRHDDSGALEPLLLS